MYWIHLLWCVLALIPKCSNGLLCYSCKDVVNTDDCLNVTECPGAEVCYGRADGFHNAEVKHTLGCTKDQVAPILTGNKGYSFCTSTCHKSLCNLKECQTGKINRPPRCFSCGLVDKPNDCRNVTKCQQGEICVAERIETFGKTKYRLGCVKDQDCSINGKITMSIIGKRTAVNHCAVCCTTDHCNRDACSSNTTGQTFQLKPLSSNASCEDSNPILCATLGRFNADACSDANVMENCPKSCKACASLYPGSGTMHGTLSGSAGVIKELKNWTAGDLTDVGLCQLQPHLCDTPDSILNNISPLPDYLSLPDKCCHIPGIPGNPGDPIMHQAGNTEE